MGTFMKVATFNTNSIRVRLPIIQQWLRNERPDVLCLQETKVVDEDFPQKEIEGMGYRAVCRGEKSYNGVAILSLHEMRNIRYGFDGSGDDEPTRFIAAEIMGVDIINTYIPQGTSPDSEKFQYKLRWIRRMGDYFSANYKGDAKLLWAGDFNVAPEPIDVHDPKRLLGHVGYHPEEHRALAGVKEWGLVDVFRRHRPEAGHYTFWDYRVRDAVKRGLGWRVDHIWATPAMAEISTGAWIDIEPRLWERPSDHTPLLAEFDLPDF